MAKTSVFSGIPRSDTEKIKNCMHCEEKYYMQGESIYTYNSDRILKVGVVADGKILIRQSNNDFVYRKDVYSKGSAFGELFGFPPLGHTVEVFAGSDCTVLFFDYQKIIHPCQNACYYHTAVLSNLFRMSSERISEEELHLSLLKKRSAREKILAFLESCSKKNNSLSFDIPYTQSALADYLCLERSAMARCLSSLRREGIIKSKGRHFELSEAYLIKSE